MTVALAVELLLALLTRTGEISALIMKLNSEGRTTFTPEEWATITSAADAAMKKLDDAIAAKETPPT